MLANGRHCHGWWPLLFVAVILCGRHHIGSIHEQHLCLELALFRLHARCTRSKRNTKVITQGTYRTKYNKSLVPHTILQYVTMSKHQASVAITGHHSMLVLCVFGLFNSSPANMKTCDHTLCFVL